MPQTLFALFLLLIFLSGCSSSAATREEQSICNSYSWGDVEQLAQPYLDDFMYTQLVMQGQSANYRPSAAAHQALTTASSLPPAIRQTLKAIIEADC